MLTFRAPPPPFGDWQKGCYPRPKFILVCHQSMAPVLYICISVFQCLCLCPGSIFFCLCKLEVAMIINSAQQRGYFSSPPPFGQITALRPPVL